MTQFNNQSVNGPENSVPDHSAGSGSYQVVARRYRPKTFEELVGQKHIAQVLSNALTTGRVGHAYLFTGARGVGKTSTARIYAKSLNCSQGPTLTPCGVCDSCIAVSLGEDIDVIEVDGASNRGIDEIRQLRQNASICPSRSQYKIYIIDEVHMLTREAFNALLKILEEPPGHVKFIFCTTEPSKIPITILSRCQRFDFAGIEIMAIAERLADIAADEQVTADEGVFELLARRASGSMRDAQSLLEQLLSFASSHISIADVHEMLGTANDQLLFRLLDAAIQCQPADIFSELESAASEGVDFGVMVEQMMGMLRDMMVVASGGNASLLLFCSAPQFEQVREHAEAFGLHRILAALQILDQTHTRMRYSTQGRVLTELALVRMSYLEHFQMVAVLLDQLREGHLPISLSKEMVLPPAGSVRTIKKSIPAPEPSKGSGMTAGDSSREARGVVVGTPARTDSVPVARAMPEVDRVPVTNEPPAGPNTKQEQSVDTRTPQQRLADASLSCQADLDELDGSRAEKIWREVADTIPGMLGTWAAGAKRIDFEKPNFFVTVFGDKATKDFCEKESPRLQNALCQAIGKSVRIRFLLEEDKKEDPLEKKVPPRARLQSEQGVLLKAAADNPMVRQVADIFGAELFEIR